MYRCTICNADNKPDYMFNDSKCMDCVTELEWQDKEEHYSYREPYQDEQWDMGTIIHTSIYRTMYRVDNAMRYISKHGWLYIIVILAGLYFPARAITFWVWGI